MPRDPGRQSIMAQVVAMIQVFPGQGGKAWALYMACWEIYGIAVSSGTATSMFVHIPRLALPVWQRNTTGWHVIFSDVQF